MRILAFLIVFAVLAGCSEESTPEPLQEGPGTQVLELDEDAAVGAISGVVVDQAIVPVTDATVSLGQGEATVTTDEDGQFVFEELAPGAYFLTVEGLGFERVQTSAEVNAGRVTTLRVQVISVPFAEPYHYTLQFDGHITFSGAVAGGITNIILDGVGVEDAACDCNFQFSTGSENVTAFIGEAFWDMSLDDPNPFCQGCLYFSFSDVNFNGAHTDFRPSPIYWAMPIEEFEDTVPDWEVSLTGNGFWPNLEQGYSIFVTVFTNAPPPDGWSIVDQA